MELKLILWLNQNLLKENEASNPFWYRNELTLLKFEASRGKAGNESKGEKEREKQKRSTR